MCTRYSTQHPTNVSFIGRPLRCADLAHFFLACRCLDAFFGAKTRGATDGSKCCRFAKSDGRGDEERENAPSLLSAWFSSSWTTVHDDRLFVCPTDETPLAFYTIFLHNRTIKRFPRIAFPFV